MALRFLFREHFIALTNEQHLNRITNKENLVSTNWKDLTKKKNS
jgi:hypothetical protein